MASTRDRRYYGFSNTGKLHKIHFHHQYRSSSRYNFGGYAPAHCGTTSLSNLQRDRDLNIESYDYCRICFKELARKFPKTLQQKLRKNDSDRLNWFQRMGITI